MSRNKGIEEGISKTGSQTALARLIGTTQPTIWKYLTGYRVVPISVALELESNPQTQVPRWKTRPDKWKRER